jgi:hypothetical protein
VSALVAGLMGSTHLRHCENGGTMAADLRHKNLVY